MPDSDSHAGCTLKCVAFFVVPVIIIYYVLKFLGVFRFLQLRLQSSFMQKWAREWGKIPLVKSTKTELFQSLKDFKSAPTILEVGAGDCRNLEYYPDGSRLIVIEPNENFHEPLTARVKEVGAHLKLDALYTDYAEKLTNVADDSVDAYVLTHVMCSITDVDAVLSEAKRVLKPGGRLYIYHHFLGPNAYQTSLKARYERYILMPVLARRIMECEYDRDIEADLRRHFPDTSIKCLEIPNSLISLRYHLVAESVNS